MTCKGGLKAALFFIGILVVLAIFWSDRVISSIHSMPPWLKILVCTGMGGVLGGVLGVLRDVPVKAMMEDAIEGFFDCTQFEEQAASSGMDFCCRARRLFIALFLGGIGGFGGSIAGLFAMIVADKLKPDQFNDLAKLTVFTTGSISGFLGFRLLKSVSDAWANKFEKELQENRRHVKRLDRKSTQSLIASLTSQMISAWNVKQTNAEQFKSDAKLALEKFNQADGKDRESLLLDPQLAVYRGLLLRHTEQLLPAIEALRSHIAAIERMGNPDRRWAHIYYNLACYLNVNANQLAAAGADPATVEALRAEAWSALKRAVVLVPTLKQDAKDETRADIAPDAAGASVNDLVGIEMDGRRKIDEL
jgi:hypothetical protein